MNKEFRVWDSADECWIDSSHLRCNVDGYLYLPYGSTPRRNVKRFIIQQYTGLTDSTGRKIFEGDILGNDLRKWEVVWNNGGFFEIKDGEYLWEVCNKMKVIGNIFETPKLLK